MPGLASRAQFQHGLSYETTTSVRNDSVTSDVVKAECLQIHAGHVSFFLPAGSCLSHPLPCQASFPQRQAMHQSAFLHPARDMAPGSLHFKSCHQNKQGEWG